MNADDIKKSLDLAEYIRSRGVVLRKRGKDLVGLCPFHKDSKPSLVVTPSKRLWHCMSCNAGGSVIDFVMKLDGVDVKAALKLLRGTLSPATPAPQAGHPAFESAAAQDVATAPTAVPSAAPVPSQPAAESKATPRGVRGVNDAPAGSGAAPQLPLPVLSPERANQLLERVVALYEKTFADVPEGRAYLESRGITDAGLFAAHRVGYCNGRLPELLPSDGRLKEELAALGVLLPGAHERFTGCVVFPVLDADGGLTTLYGRFTGEGSGFGVQGSGPSESSTPRHPTPVPLPSVTCSCRIVLRGCGTRPRPRRTRN